MFCKGGVKIMNRLMNDVEYLRCDTAFGTMGFNFKRKERDLF